MLPIGQELGEPARVQPAPRLLNERAAQIVPGHAAVAVGEPGVGRDDERRVGHDQVVRLLLRDRLEQGALAQIGGGRPGEGEGERGDVQRTRVDVRRGHPRGVPGGVQRLDAGAGAEVERGAHGCADGEPGQRRRGAAHAEHHGLLTAADAARAADRATEVGDDEPVVAVGPAVRPHVDGGGDLVCAVGGAGQPAGLHAGLDGQRRRHAREGHGLLQQEQPDECLQRGVAPGGPQRRDHLTAGEGGVGRGAEEFEQPVGGEGGRPQRVPQRGGDVEAVGGRQGAEAAGGAGWEVLTPPLWPARPPLRPPPRPPAHRPG